MDTVTTIARMLIRLCGMVALILGVLFWVRIALNLIPVHMVIGLVLVLSLWTLAAVAVRAGIPYGLIALVVVWGLVTLLLGMFQGRLLLNSAHWVIRVLHLLVGMGAMGLGETLAGRIKRAQVVTT